MGEGGVVTTRLYFSVIKKKSGRMDENRKAYLRLNKGTLVSKGPEQR